MGSDDVDDGRGVISVGAGDGGTGVGVDVNDDGVETGDALMGGSGMVDVSTMVWGITRN